MTTTVRAGIRVRVQLHDDSCENDGRLGSNLRQLSSAGSDLSYAVQEFLPHISFGFEFSEGLTGQLLTHLGMPPTVKGFCSELGASRRSRIYAV